MERIGYFRSANPFNITWNLISGNNFPLTEERRNPNFFLLLWIILTWFFKVSYVSAVVVGPLYFAQLTAEEVFKMSGCAVIVFVEMMIPTIYLNFQRTNLCKLIRKYNDVLIDSDDLRASIHDTVKSYVRILKIYIYVALAGASLWGTAAIAKIFNNDQFTYMDFTAPAYFPGEPFGRTIFIFGVLFQTIGVCTVNMGKIGVEVYVSYFILVLTAEYKYLRRRVANVLRPERNQEDERSIIIALNNCVRHHSAVIKIGQELSKMLAFHIGATYFTCILKFCFLVFGLFTFGSAIIETISYMSYSSGCLLQIYVFCSCVQELFNESTSVTDDAFHENWHIRSNAVKRIFCMMELSNQIVCRLSAYGIVDLIVPTLAVILSKSYSVCLLLLKVN